CFLRLQCVSSRASCLCAHAPLLLLHKYGTCVTPYCKPLLCPTDGFLARANYQRDLR
ncbi:unnamed protein product, partial [Ectocarpus sp. 8 AP-2014]